MGRLNSKMGEKTEQREKSKIGRKKKQTSSMPNEFPTSSGMQL